MLPKWVVPGQEVARDRECREYEVGAGLELRNNVIKCTLLGEINVTNTNNKKRLDVINKFVNPYGPQTAQTNSLRATSSLPQVGDVVYAQVTRLGHNQVHVQILVVENKGEILPDSGVGWSANAVGTVRQATGSLGDLAELGESYGGIIRTTDIRAYEREKVSLAQCFRPGDIVRASILSLGDGSNYYLSTIRNDLGVVFAQSEHGYELIPLDWQTMLAPKSQEVEPRKCANPFA